MTMVAGMRSLAKAMELPPEPNVRAPALDPTYCSSSLPSSLLASRRSLIRMEMTTPLSPSQSAPARLTQPSKIWPTRV